MARPSPAAAISRAYHRARGVRIHPTSRVPIRSRLTRHTTIGPGTFVNGPATCKGGGTITIGPHCAIGADLLVTTTNHDMRFANMMLRMHWNFGFVDLESSDDVEIGPACWIGDRVTVLAGARIGAGVVIAAGAVVPRGVYEDYSVLGGVPAKVIRRRSSEQVAAALVATRWWEWQPDRIARNRTFFETPIDDAEPDRIDELVVD